VSGSESTLQDLQEGGVKKKLKPETGNWRGSGELLVTRQTGKVKGERWESIKKVQ